MSVKLEIPTGVSHPLSFLAGIGVAVAWTTAGVLIAASQQKVMSFLREWYLLQGFPMLVLGTWLTSIVRSGTFDKRLSRLTSDSAVDPPLPRSARYLIICGVGVVGTASLIRLGFNVEGALLLFMWFTAACICFTAGYATAHTIDVLLRIHRLQGKKIVLFRYAPARTPELREIVSYFTSFGLLLSAGYAFTVVGTLLPSWSGPTDYVQIVQIGWPMIYVPTCTAALLYPHIVMHRLIRREKEQTLLSCQKDIDSLLQRYADLNREDVERTNTLAQLFDRIIATPDYVVDFGIAFRTLLPLGFNLVTLVAKAALGQPTQ